MGFNKKRKVKEFHSLIVEAKPAMEEKNGGVSKTWHKKEDVKGYLDKYRIISYINSTFYKCPKNKNLSALDSYEYCRKPFLISCRK